MEKLVKMAKNELKGVRAKMFALALDIAGGEVSEEFIRRETRSLNHELQFWEKIVKEKSRPVQKRI